MIGAVVVVFVGVGWIVGIVLVGVIGISLSPTD